MLEARIEYHLRNKIRLRYGGLVLKLAPSIKGMPDRLVVIPGGQMFFVELKAPNGRLSEAQKHFHERLKSLGSPVAVISSIEDADQWINVLKPDPREDAPIEKKERKPSYRCRVCLRSHQGNRPADNSCPRGRTGEVRMYKCDVCTQRHEGLYIPGQCPRRKGYHDFKATNLARTHCLRGHEFTEENTYWRFKRSNGTHGRTCLQCRRDDNDTNDKAIGCRADTCPHTPNIGSLPTYIAWRKALEEGK